MALGDRGTTVERKSCPGHCSSYIRLIRRLSGNTILTTVPHGHGPSPPITISSTHTSYTIRPASPSICWCLLQSSLQISQSDFHVYLIPNMQRILRRKGQSLSAYEMGFTRAVAWSKSASSEEHVRGRLGIGLLLRDSLCSCLRTACLHCEWACTVSLPTKSPVTHRHFQEFILEGIAGCHLVQLLAQQTINLDHIAYGICPKNRIFEVISLNTCCICSLSCMQMSSPGPVSFS